MNSIHKDFTDSEWYFSEDEIAYLLNDKVDPDSIMDVYSNAAEYARHWLYTLAKQDPDFLLECMEWLVDFDAMGCSLVESDDDLIDLPSGRIVDIDMC